MPIKSFFLFYLLLATSFNSFCQEKKISKADVPIAIKSFIETNYPSASAVRFYKEIKGDTVFIESEFFFKKDKYALKFLKDVLIETEVWLPFNEISSATKSKIKSGLDSIFASYSILKCEEVNPQQNTHYEIYIKGKTKNDTGYFDCYFDKVGNFLRKEEIDVKPIESEF
jgi:hypothetical protein